MSREDVEVVHSVFDAISRHDLAAFLDLMDAGVIAVPRIVAVEGGPLEGHEGIREWWDAIFNAFPDFHIDVVSVRSVGDVTVSRAFARGRGQGSDAPFEDAIWVTSGMRSGKVVWWQTHQSEAQALEAVGLRE